MRRQGACVSMLCKGRQQARSTYRQQGARGAKQSIRHKGAQAHTQQGTSMHAGKGQANATWGSGGCGLGKGSVGKGALRIQEG